jgi:putative phage-type endonuclease
MNIYTFNIYKFKKYKMIYELQYFIILMNKNNILNNLQKYNGIYQINSKTDIDNLINKITNQINTNQINTNQININQINTNQININNIMIKEILSKYSYIYNNQLIFDMNYKTFNTYDTLLKYFDKKTLPIRHNSVNDIFGPFGSQWIHDIQKDDDVNSDELKRRRKQFEKLNSIKYPAQRSPEWYIQRDGKITASDAGVVIGENKYEQPYRMIVKKTRETFQNNEATYHGKKYEDIAKLIYEYRANVLVKEFGMVEHPEVKCIGASPDGIVTPYKNDGIHLTNMVGRMLEIKVPLRRQICKVGEVKGEICPIYYWDQVQLQMECCDLDECDFWQTTICEYPNKDIFINDTCKSESFRSKTTSFEKGLVIQLLPKNTTTKIGDDDYLKIVHESAQFIHPPKIEMNPEDCDIWESEILKEIEKTHPDYRYDRTIYWFLKVSHCVTIERDKQWFADNKHKYEEMWANITLIRSKQIYKNTFLDFVDSTSLGDKDYNIEPIRNNIIFKFINILKYDDITDIINKWNNKFKSSDSKNSLKEKLEKFNNELEQYIKN